MAEARRSSARAPTCASLKPGNPVWSRSRRATDQYRSRAVLAFDGVEAVCFNAPVVELVRDPRRPVAHLGPDVLGEDFDLPEVMRRARGAAAATVGELLLDQRVCAGVGNIYKCEALWK